MTLRFARIAAIGTLAAAFALGGCGRKGALDPPPGAAGYQPARTASPAGVFSPISEPQTLAAPAAFDEQGRPVAPLGAPKRRLPMDWLID